MIAAFASAGVAISLYPLLRSTAKVSRSAQVGFRVMEGVPYVVSALAVLLLLSLSQEFVTAGAPAGSSFQTTGDC